ncbi:MAG: selenocysteine-specific translation elongation factor [Terriglobales bacterium]
MVVGTAGHIDHGKSALVEALTGVHPDRLEAEQRRGMTLDLGFGFSRQGGESMSFVDVPGHERLIRSMLAGAAGFDVVLLVVAADAGVQPQTMEHVALCRLLAIGQAVVALSKRDLVDAAQAERVRGQIAALLRPTPYADAPVVEVSGRTRAGVAELRQALLEAGRKAEARDAQAPFRLAVDRAFHMKGFGPVVTGTLLQGTLRAGARAELAPLGADDSELVRLRGLQVHGASVDSAAAGQRVAANLVGVEGAALHRGLELLEPGAFASTRTLDAAITWLPGAPVLAHRARCRLHLHTIEVVATLLWLEAPAGGAAEHGYAQLRLAAPVVAAAGDRFILRRLSPAMTLGGGLVLEPGSRPHRKPDYAAAAGRLAALAAADSFEASLILRLQQAGTMGCELAALARATGRRTGEVAEVLQRAAAEGRALLSSHPAAALAAEAMPEIEAALVGALEAFHRREPLAEGAALETLGLAYPQHWLALAARGDARQSMSRLAQQVQAVAGGRWRLARAAPARSAGQLELRGRIAAHVEALGWSAPPLPQLLAPFPQREARALVADLARAGVLVECQPGWYLHAATVARLRTLLTERRAGQAEFSVGDFKQWTGLSRKLAIPLLEYCDRARLTRRAGENRVIII